EDDRGARGRDAVLVGDLERVFDGLLNVQVDRELQPLAFRRLYFFERPDFAADAVHDDAARAVLADQILVVNALDARLPGEIAALERRIPGDLRIADLADVPEQVRAHRVRVAACRDALAEDVGKLGIQPAGDHRRDLRERGILNNRDGTIRRLAAM